MTRVLVTRVRSCVREDLGEILVTAAREADDDQLRGQAVDPRERMRRLERRDDPLGACEPPEGLERLVVCGADVTRTAGVAQESVLGTDAGIVEPGRDRGGVRDLSV